ncbi:hypothetical protein B7463_g3792, partial [Scytalidium lignicola]
MTDASLPTLKWGVVGCGLISSWFVHDLLRERPSATTKHIIQAIGSSSLEKGTAFHQKYAPSAKPSIYASYHEVYNDPEVQIVYIGTPHSVHLQNALDAINAGKHVLCEKPMTINAKETETMIKAAREKGVFLMEAVWTRFFPIASALQKLLYEDQVIGKISRMYCDFGLDMPMSSLESTARTADPSLGAGCLLDMGIYCLTWTAIVTNQVSKQPAPPKITSSMSFTNGVDEMTTAVLNYPTLHFQSICTTSMLHRTTKDFCRVEGEKGSIVVGGDAASKPGFLIIRPKGGEEKRIEFDSPGWGFYYEADAVAEDLRRGRIENEIMPLNESLRMMKLMDEIRAQNGLKYKADLLEDARKATEVGVQGIVVSNHGGRQCDGGVGSLDTLPEIVDAVGDQLEIIFNSGVRCGMDIVKALALGAKMVLIGRPFVWGLSLASEEGVRHVLKSLLGEVSLQE